eukprot:TRINITY_DN18092_c0_g1_i1.p1 TRINITY_DN18092_c0_g1~~TRINITY_DN18092_c0_g1_i1.p1  ORF type:complete len:391 (+),score=38.00 TRINITY_DN18092_c0_g1_i1:84-1256(+)
MSATFPNDTDTILRTILVELTGLKRRVESIEGRLEREERECRTVGWGLKEVKVQLLGGAAAAATGGNSGGTVIKDLCSEIREDLAHITRLSATVGELEGTVLKMQLDMDRAEGRINRTTNEVVTLKQFVRNNITGRELDTHTMGLRKATGQPMASLSKSLEICFESEDHLRRLHEQNKALRRELRGLKKEKRGGHNASQSFLRVLEESGSGWMRNVTSGRESPRKRLPDRLELAEKIVRGSTIRSEEVVPVYDPPVPPPPPPEEVTRVSSLRNAKSTSPPMSSQRHAVIQLTQEPPQKTQPPVRKPPSTAASSSLHPDDAPTHRTVDTSSSLDFNEPPPTSPASTASSSLALQSVSASQVTAPPRPSVVRTSSSSSSAGSSLSSLEFVDA